MKGNRILELNQNHMTFLSGVASSLNREEAQSSESSAGQCQGKINMLPEVKVQVTGGK